jgi:hypothetical protein
MSKKRKKVEARKRKKAKSWERERRENSFERCKS